MTRPTIHVGGLFPPSFGPAKTLCGLSLPMDREHFFIMGERPPRGHRRCPECDKKLAERRKRFP